MRPVCCYWDSTVACSVAHSFVELKCHHLYCVYEHFSMQTVVFCLFWVTSRVAWGQFDVYSRCKKLHAFADICFVTSQFHVKILEVAFHEYMQYLWNAVRESAGFLQLSISLDIFWTSSNGCGSCAQHCWWSHCGNPFEGSYCWVLLQSEYQVTNNNNLTFHKVLFASLVIGLVNGKCYKATVSPSMLR